MIKKDKKDKKVIEIDCSTCKYVKEHKDELFCSTRMKDDSDYSSSSKVGIVKECGYFKIK